MGICSIHDQYSFRKDHLHEHRVILLCRCIDQEHSKWSDKRWDLQHIDGRSQNELPLDLRISGLCTFHLGEKNDSSATAKSKDLAPRSNTKEPLRMILQVAYSRGHLAKHYTFLLPFFCPSSKSKCQVTALWIYFRYCYCRHPRGTNKQLPSDSFISIKQALS